ncbi:ATP-dependent RNA helicase DHX8 [Armadillidium nasatum]|uniref:ATP-dependent RNA helicase DHX8 n=1 Tax=Armadillidium nasatum TaxID=96803 RepID=A0A5N5SZ12_9CRUS|nr:ATP-dependent RNA helicase DHX8 [Armadillidium nasatum]
MTMDEIQKLEHFSLVSKICVELENHLNINDKDLAEFIISLAEKGKSLEKFRKELVENGGEEFADSFVESLWRLISHMKPSIVSGNIKEKEYLSSKSSFDNKRELLPFLAMPNDPKIKVKEEIKEELPVDDLMAFLESQAPSKMNEKEKEKNGTKVIDRQRSRSRSPQHLNKSGRNRSRSRGKYRNKSKSRSRERRSRSRSRVRRSRSRDRYKRDKRRNSRDRSRERHRSRSREKRRKDKERKRSRSHERRKRKNRSRSTSIESRSKESAQIKVPDENPTLGKVYEGKVTNILNFGCFVQLEGLKRRLEGLVHISQLRREGRVTNVGDVVTRGQKVKVKVLSFTGQKTSLSMKDVDQGTGEDLNPSSVATNNDVPDEEKLRNPDRPVTLVELTRAAEEQDMATYKRVNRVSSPERWELKQMMAASCITKSELPDFDEELGVLGGEDDDEEEVEIELVEEEPAFLRGYGRVREELSPVRIMKNPDGSLAQAAMMQSALAKERRELKMAQRDAEMDSQPAPLWTRLE